MTRAEVLAQYQVRNGRIVSPGQFEGEAVYVPHYWEVFLDGFADRDNGRVIGFDITAEDRAEYPELGKRRRTVRLEQTDTGFVCEV